MPGIPRAHMESVEATSPEAVDEIHPAPDVGPQVQMQPAAVGCHKVVP